MWGGEGGGGEEGGGGPSDPSGLHSLTFRWVLSINGTYEHTEVEVF